MNYRDFLQRVIYVIINPIIQVMVKVGITPNMVTTIGFVGNLAATSLFVVAALMVRSGDMAQAMEMVGWGGATILFAGLFDMMDGRLARVSGKSSVFGALWDSTLDRYRWFRSSASRSYSFTATGSGWASLPMQPSWVR